MSELVGTHAATYHTCVLAHFTAVIKLDRFLLGPEKKKIRRNDENRGFPVFFSSQKVVCISAFTSLSLSLSLTTQQHTHNYHSQLSFSFYY
jgi:hypothetical protein